MIRKKNNKHNYDFEFWGMIKTSNLIFHGIEEGHEVQIEGIENIFKETIAENSPNLEMQGW